MERRNWSLKALSEFTYLDSLDEEQKLKALEAWFQFYLRENQIEDFDLTTYELKKLSELLYKNINFFKQSKDALRYQLKDNSKIREFFH